MDPIKLPDGLAKQVEGLQEKFNEETEALREKYQEDLNEITGKYQYPLNLMLMGFLADKGVPSDQNYYVENGQVVFVDAKQSDDAEVLQVANGAEAQG